MFLIYLKQTLRIVTFVVFCLFVFRTFIYEPGIVNGRSMEPTFEDNDFFLVNKWILLFREPRRGDVIQAHDAQQEKILIKRIIGMPGERLSIHDGAIFLLDETGQEQQMVELYIGKNMRTEPPENKPTVYIRIPPYRYFIVGDNRPLSGDSRQFGPIHRSTIYGLVTKLPSFSKKN